MSDDLWEQARAISSTARAIQTRVLARRLPSRKADRLTDLTLPQLSMMLVLRDHGEMSLKEIADAMAVSPPSASAMVERLVDVGVARREHSTVDRREIRISLSAEGTEASNIFEQHMLQSVVKLLKKIGPECARQWYDVYTRVHEVLDEDMRERIDTDGVFRTGAK